MQKISFISFGLFGEFICEIMPIGFSFLESIYAENRVYWLWPHWRFAC